MKNYDKEKITVPLLTVIIPIYNCEKYLKKCVESVMYQTLDDIEIILVDDGSDDDCGKICERLKAKDNRVKYIKKSHSGPIETRRLGVEVATADYVTFVDADDWVEIDAYERFVSYMEHGYDVIKYLMVQDYDSKAQIFYKNKYRVGEYKREQIEKEIFPSMIWNIEKGENGVSSSLCDKIVKREILAKSFALVKDLHYHYCEDSTVVFPMYRWVNSIMITEEVVYHHCKHEDNVSPYVCAADFFDNLYLWYRHLVKNMDFLNGATRQIEEIYVSAMRPRLLMYGDRPDRVRNLFPFKRIKPDSDIILWGYGVVGKSYMMQIDKSKYCNVLSIVDSGYVQINMDGERKVESPERIRELSFDYVVIAIWNEDARKSIVKILTEWNIDNNKIAW